MCDLTNEFKLCTCEFDASKIKHTWKLFRKDADFDQIIVGEYYIPDIEWNKITLPEIIEYYLNKAQDNKGLFDKEITLCENDILVFYDEDKLCFQFDYSMCRWCLVDSKKEPNHTVVNRGKISVSSKKISE